MSEVGTLTKCTGIHMYLSSISINIPQTIVLFHLYASINTVNARNIYIYIYISEEQTYYCCVEYKPFRVVLVLSSFQQPANPLK